jgi:putative endonuclease
MISWRVYLLRCSDDSLDFGVTTDVDHRLQEHNQEAGARYTSSRLPVALVWSSGELTKSDAFKEEYQIKRLSKAMKEGIIDTGGNKKKSPGEERQG